MYSNTKMKIICILAIVAFVKANHLIRPFAARSISSTVVAAIEDFRDQMPCGFPKLGIPILAPMVIEHIDINIDTPTLVAAGALDSLYLKGLSDFKIVDMRVNALKKLVNFRFHFDNVNVETLHDFKVLLRKGGFTLNMIGGGYAKFAIKDLIIWGSLKYSLGIKSNKLKLKSLDVRAHIGMVDSDIGGVLGNGGLNYRMNKFLEKAVELMINENQVLLSKTVESIALPIVNDVLDKFTLKDLVSGAGGEKTKCVPSNEESKRQIIV